MACHSCATKFGLFKKELGCPNCGYAFCAKCRTKKAVVPAQGRDTHHVCNKCYDKLMGKAKEDKPMQFDLPENYLKRVEALNKKGTSHPPPGVRPGHKPGADHKHGGFASKDTELEMRLKRLKDNPGKGSPPPKQATHAEIEERLARLKGVHPSTLKSNDTPMYRPPDVRTETQKTEDLLSEIQDRVEVESHWPDPATEVAQRLEQLRNGPAVPAPSAMDSQNDLNKPSLSKSNPGPSELANIPGDFSNVKPEPDSVNSNDDGIGKDIDAAMLSNLLQDAQREVEEDARRAMQSLEKDNEIRFKLDELKKNYKEQEHNKPSPIDCTQIGGEEYDEVDSEEETSEQATERLINQLVSEAKLEEELGTDPTSSGSSDNVAPSAASKSHHSSKPSHKTRKTVPNVALKHRGKTNFDDEGSNTSELPWCCICNEDACLRCHGCMDDLYCMRCFREAHDEYDMSDHKTVRFHQPQSK
ncbi:PREDICTED: abscission/NoCut checkpoint regulator-like isoform X2 [Priapulus caudatus]|uniref:Abscission/NoCut checkpoint regulator-like isoform X2 n=1 Tax=Priapulus caudatus TaxID=37621 RepID=A0ABM1F8P4_PRICU|nr:PREDICTED: abscission/NoCut checkpoint regulator-like isoform X2 [Priapulus caudatus]